MLTILFCLVFFQTEDASSYFERAAYLEQTMGDMDAAIEVYKEIIQNQSFSKRDQAKALLLAAKIQKKNGNELIYNTLLTRLIEDHPTQNDLVREAKQLRGDGNLIHQLKAIPWGNHETLHYLEMGKGKRGLMTIAISKTQNGDWVLLEQRHGALYPSTERAYLKGETFTPVTGRFRSLDYGNYQSEFKDQTILVESVDGRKMTFNMNEPTYLELQAMFITRRMPFAKDLLIDVPVYSHPMLMKFDLRGTITGRETITVAAGTFDCWVMESPMPFKIWIHAESPYQMVKYDIPEMKGELLKVSERNLTEGTTYTNEELGYQLELPAEWSLVNWPQSAESWFMTLQPELHGRVTFEKDGTAQDWLSEDYQEGKHPYQRQSLRLKHGDGFLYFVFEGIRDKMPGYEADIRSVVGSYKAID